jgi:hypothetical protein
VRGALGPSFVDEHGHPKKCSCNSAKQSEVHFRALLTGEGTELGLARVRSFTVISNRVGEYSIVSCGAAIRKVGH